RHARRGREDHIRAVHGDLLLRQRRRDPHQRRPARLAGPGWVGATSGNVVITKIAISGYRSLRDIKLGLGGLNFVTGANGSGKSSLYRAVRLLADIAQGRVIQSLAAEGGLRSTLWAGPEAFSRRMKAG